MRKITLLLLFLSSMWGHSQVKNYTFSKVQGTYQSLVSGLPLGSVTSDDQYFVAPSPSTGDNTINSGDGIPIGFDFIFNGYTFNRFGVQANGWIALGSSTVTPAINMICGLPTTPLTANYPVTPDVLTAKIIPLGKDLQAQANSFLSYKTLGDSPNRTLVIEWKNYRRKSVLNESLTFQVRLNETSNTVDFVYGSTIVNGSTTCEVGLRAEPSAQITNYLCVTSATNWASVTVGTSSANTVTLSDVIQPAIGLTYTWTPPTCNDPKTLTTTALSTNSATINWSSYLPVPSGYQYINSTSATVPLATASGTATADPTATLTGLNANTSYYVFVRSICDTQVKPWILVGSYKTKCEDATSLSEGFDTGAMPSCWESVATGTGTCTVSTGALKIAVKGATPDVVYAILPNVSNLQANTNRLRFKVYQTTVNTAVKTIDVGYFTNRTDSSTFKSIATNTVTATTAATMQEFIVEPTDILDSDKVLVFKCVGDTPTTFSNYYIDNVVWEPKSSCLSNVTSVAVKLPTSNSVQLTWASTGTETAWQYVYASSSVSDPNTLPSASIVDTDTKAVTVTGLLPSTNYRIWVRSNCGNGDFGTWVGSPAFLTPCTSVATIYEDFDMSLSLPNCWHKVGTDDGTVSVELPAINDSSNSLLLVSSRTNGSGIAVYAAIPPVSTYAAPGYIMRFKYKANYAGSRLQVITYNDPINPSTFTIWKDITVTDANTWYSLNETLQIPTTGTPYFAFRIYHPTQATSVRIDNFVWEALAPCPDVTSITQNEVIGNSAKLSWTGSGTENNWQYAITATKTADPTTLSATDFASPPIANQTNITGIIPNLDPLTSYKLWIRSKCNDNSVGSWIGASYFTTTCLAVPEFTESFDSSTNLPLCWRKVGTGPASVVSSVGINSSNALKIDVNTTIDATKGIVTMMPVTNSGDNTHILRFRLSGTVGAQVEVGYMTDANTFHSLNNSFTVASSTAYSNESTVLGYDPTSQVLAFRNMGTNGTTNTIYIDDVHWEVLPVCSDISNPIITGITNTTVGLSWTRGTNEEEWQYALSTTPVSDTKTLTAVDFTSPVAGVQLVSSTLDGLTSSTNYKVWIRSKCADYIFGTWVGPYSFTTACDPVSTFTEKFDINTDLPACWTKVGLQGIVIPGSLVGAPSGTNALKLISNATDKALVALPPVNNAATGQYILKFKYSSSVADGNIQIGYVTNITDPTYETDPSKPTSFNLVEAVSTGTSSTGVFVTKTISLGTLPTSQFLAFRNPDNSTIYIDDVSWQLPSPTTCASGITAVPNANCGNDATVISWPTAINATGYKLTIGTTSGGNDVLDQDLGDKLSYSLIGNVSTKYYFTLTPYNPSGPATGCQEQTFTTAANTCYCTSVPTGKDGNGITNVTLGASNFDIPYGLNIPKTTYNDFTARPVNVAPDATANLRLEFFTGYNLAYHINVWIDLNDNKYFEPSEIQFKGDSSSNAGLTFVDGSFTMPLDAPLGLHRMRLVATKVDLSTNPDPCYSGPNGVTLDFKVNVVAPPANDQPSGAVVLTVGKAFSDDAINGTNINATGSVQEQAPGCGNYNGSDVWYKAVVPVSGNITFEVNSISGGISNTAAAVYSSDIVLIACDDSSSTTGKSVNGGDQPEISLIGRIPGETLYMRVWDNGGDAYGNYLVSAYENSLGTDTFNIANFTYYPNPVKDIFNISYDQEISDVVVMNLLGQRVLSKSVNDNQVKIDMSGLPKGTYLIKITAGNQTKTVKAVKE